jgi:hypothetical protein
MKKKLLTGLLFFLAIEVFSQSSDITVLQDQKIVGQVSVSQKDISAKEYIFPERINEFYIDTTSHFLTVQLRGVSKNGKWLNNTGDLVQYDLNGSSVKWTRKMNYQTSSIRQFANTIIYSMGNKSHCLHVETGENLWEVKNDIYYVDSHNNMGIGYKFKTSTGLTNKLEGIDLKTGAIVWQKELSREFGWNSVFHLNDSVLLIVAAGLHTINTNNGKGWDYNAITGKKDYKGTVAANAAGLALGLLTGVGTVTTGYNLVKDIASNVLVDSASLYFASKENIARIDPQSGNVIWSFTIPNDLSSKSSIFIKDSILYMVNKGYAFMGYRQLNIGTPFIAAFNKVSGKQIFFSEISEKKDPILDFQIKNDTLALVFKNSVLVCSMLDGSKVVEKVFNADEYGELKYFIGDQIYTSSNDSIFNRLIFSNTSKNYILTSKDNVFALDKDLNICEEFATGHLYINYLNTRNYLLVAKGNQTTILDKECHRIADVSASRNAFLIGDKLYDIQEKNLLEIDLTELIEKKD